MFTNDLDPLDGDGMIRSNAVVNGVISYAKLLSTPNKISKPK